MVNYITESTSYVLLYSYNFSRDVKNFIDASTMFLALK